MNQISSHEDLLKAIKILEAENALRAVQMKEVFELAVATLSPALAVTKTLRDVTSSPHLLKDLLGSAFGIASGYITRKLYVRGSSNLFKVLMGIGVQYGVDRKSVV